MAGGELEGAAKKSVVLHLAGCADCSREVLALRQAEAEARSADSAVGEIASTATATTRSPATGIGNRMAWLAAAAAALLLISIPVWRAQSPPVDGAVVRGTEAPLDAAPTGTISAAPTSLQWPAQLGATGYVPKLYSGAADLLWTGPVTTDVSVALPEDVIRQMHAEDASFVWTVDVRGSAARSELGPFWFHVRPTADEPTPDLRPRDG